MEPTGNRALQLQHMLRLKPSNGKPGYYDLNFLAYSKDYSNNLDVYGFLFDYYAARDRSTGHQFFKLAFSEDYQSFVHYFGCTGDFIPTECYTAQESGLNVSAHDRLIYTQLNDLIEKLRVRFGVDGDENYISAFELIALVENNAGMPGGFLRFPEGLFTDISPSADPLLVQLISWQFGCDYRMSPQSPRFDFGKGDELVAQIRREEQSRK